MQTTSDMAVMADIAVMNGMVVTADIRYTTVMADMAVWLSGCLSQIPGNFTV